jgi:phage portal protein BeeE
MAIAAESLGWAKAAQLFGANFFGSGATPSGIVTMKRPLTPEGLESLENRFHRLYGGANNSNRVAFLDNEMEYKAISIEPDKGQFIETNQYLLDEVCRWFGVPPHKIYNLLRATFSNIEHQSIEVVQDSLRPWAKRFQNEADYKLFGIENRQRFYTVMDFTELLRGDTKTRLDYYRGLREIGVLSANEIRENEDLPPIPKPQGGDKRVMQGQYTTLEKIGEQPAPGSTTPGGNAPADDPKPDEAAPPDENAGNAVPSKEPVPNNAATQHDAEKLAEFYRNVWAVKEMTDKRVSA